MAVAAEFKRSSPSKGDIVPPATSVDAFASAYTLGGANIISVLTEPTWFKGTLEDMEAARIACEAAVASAGLSCRPLILRKDFIIDAYQLLEARAYGADTVLLIVASLPTVAALAPLIGASRELGMEPLVEVNTVAELDVALAAGARVVGINNRNLRTFEVDMGTTTRIVAHAAAGALAAAGKGTSCSGGVAPPPLAILSLSGIKTGKDVLDLAAECAQSPGGSSVIRGFLIGEALMRCANPQALVRELREAGVDALNAGKAAILAPLPPPRPQRLASALTSKVCGVRSAAAAVHAARCGAGFVGMILVAGSPRSIDTDCARDIAARLRAFREQDPGALLKSCAALPSAAAAAEQQPGIDFPRLCAAGDLLRAASLHARPLCVGVFRGESAVAVLATATSIGLDLVQLHGTESAADFAGFPLPIVKVLHVTGSGGEVDAALLACIAQWSRVAAALLLDSPGGGTGVAFQHDAFFPALDSSLRGLTGVGGGWEGAVPFWLAGGLKPGTLRHTLTALRACVPLGPRWATLYTLDVSSGVEVDGGEKGVKDPSKVEAFVKCVGEVVL